MQSATNIGVFGTGAVGRTIAARLADLGHSVVIGTRDPNATRARTTNDAMGNPPFSVWQRDHAAIGLGTFSEVAAHGDILVNATVGTGAMAALELAGSGNLAGKILIDVSNPLDFSKGMPPSLTICNTDSLGESIQRAFPDLRVVKTLNTVNAQLMVAPERLASGEHTMFIAGSDAGAKARVVELLHGFGWSDIVDLGDITGARAMEMLLPVWVRLWGVTKTPLFSFKLVR